MLLFRMDNANLDALGIFKFPAPRADNVGVVVLGFALCRGFPI